MRTAWATHSRAGKLEEQPAPKSLTGNNAMIYVDFAVCSIGAISSAVAAMLWFYAAHIKVPDNRDKVIGELQRINRLTARAAVAFGIAALCAAYIFAQFLPLVPFLMGT
jgi:hypothetical protein